MADEANMAPVGDTADTGSEDQIATVPEVATAAKDQPEQSDSSKMTVAEMTGYTPEDVAIIQKTVAKDTTGVELAYFLQIAKGVGLNPLVKEIWCYKNSGANGSLVIFAGRDGFLSIAQRDAKFMGMRSSEVKKNDAFTADLFNDKIEHTISNKEPRGAVVGAWAKVFRKDGEPTIVYVDMANYDRGTATWKSHPDAMIKKVAEAQALRKAFGIHGLYVEEEFDIREKNGQRVIVSEGAQDVIEAASVDGANNYGSKILTQLDKLGISDAEEGLKKVSDLLGYEVKDLNTLNEEAARNVLTKLLTEKPKAKEAQVETTPDNAEGEQK